MKHWSLSRPTKEFKNAWQTLTVRSSAKICAKTFRFVGPRCAVIAITL